MTELLTSQNILNRAVRDSGGLALEVAVTAQEALNLVFVPGSDALNVTGISGGAIDDGTATGQFAIWNDTTGAWEPQALADLSFVGGDLSVNSGTDADTILGRGALCSPTTDVIYFGHIDRCSNADYALKQNASGDTQINARATHPLIFSIGNVGIMNLTPTALAGSSLGNPKIAFEVASGTNPTLLPSNLDDDTGVGRANADQLSMISGGVESIRTTESAGLIEVDLYGKTRIVDSAAEAPLSITERSVAPTNPIANDIYLDDGTNTLTTKPAFRVYTGGAWQDIGAPGGNIQAGTIENQSIRWDVANNQWKRPLF